MICKNCSREIPDDFTYCPYCGKRTDGKKICKNCGAEISEEYAFCPKCGSVQNGDYAPENKTARDGNVGYVAEEAPAPSDKQGGERIPLCNGAEFKESKKKSRPERKRKSPDFKRLKDSMDKGLISRIVLIVVTAVFFICSFCGVMTVNITGSINNDIINENVRLEKDLKAEFTAVDLMNLGFFVLSTDYDSASDYTSNEIDEIDYIEKIMEIFSDDELVKYNALTEKIMVTEKGCDEISKILTDVKLLKYAYASTLVESPETSESVGAKMNTIATAGILLLVNVVVSASVFIISLVYLLAGKKKSGIILVSLAFLFIIALSAYIPAVEIGNEYVGDASMGPALVAAVVFGVLFYAYRLGMRIVTERRESVKMLVANATAVVAGVLVLCCAALPAVNTTLTYVPQEEDAKNVKFDYSFSQFETMNEYYFDIGEDNYIPSSELKTIFDDYAQQYTDPSSRSEGEAFFKTSIGLNGFMNTSFFSDEYGIVKSVVRVQPIMALIALYAVAAMVSFGLAYLCGGKNVAAIKLIALILLLISAAYGIFSTILLDMTLRMSAEFFPKYSIEVGPVQIIQVVMAVVGIVGLIVSLAFKNKCIDIGKTQEEETPVAEEDDMIFVEK